jgi:formyltetrahydrofolate deformylase
VNVETMRLLITCPDTRGIVAAVAGFLSGYQGNIVALDQHSDALHGRFYMRAEVALEGFALEREGFAAAWNPIASRFGMSWRTHWGPDTRRVAILVTREGHCLSDLLFRCAIGELQARVACVIGNHETLRRTAESAGIPFHHVPTDAGQEAHERGVRDLLASEASHPDLIVLARYMRVLSADFVAAYPERIINIHHSFLPAFAGPRPYHQAFERGVKIIGATSHYVTADLDQGPIIAQQTVAVGHRDTVEDLVRKGRDLERMVLASAVRLHLEDRILTAPNKTVVFE